MKGLFWLLFVAFLLALIQACSNDNHSLDPSCTISETDLIERWWYPDERYNGQYSRLYFKADGALLMPLSGDSVRYELSDCNKLSIANFSVSSSEFCAIKRLTNTELVLYFDRGREVWYSRNI